MFKNKGKYTYNQYKCNKSRKKKLIKKNKKECLKLKKKYLR